MQLDQPTRYVPGMAADARRYAKEAGEGIKNEQFIWSINKLSIRPH